MGILQGMHHIMLPLSASCPQLLPNRHVPLPGPLHRVWYVTFSDWRLGFPLPLLWSDKACYGWARSRLRELSQLSPLVHSPSAVGLGPVKSVGLHALQASLLRRTSTEAFVEAACWLSWPRASCASGQQIIAGWVRQPKLMAPVLDHAHLTSRKFQSFCVLAACHDVGWPKI